ncbi:MFS transporter [Erythrobacter alti]|uniref:MFS transporter n=1 Tax=Erythrobacter alti TaxID=1896145 RepID=UPI0030F40118
MSTAPAQPRSNPFSPLRERTFRRIWSASVLGNLGQLILGVGAAWEMTRLSSSTTMVALVQTAMMLPLMIASVPAGALADMYDRRKVAMSGLLVSMLSAGTLATIAVLGLATPWTLLTFCFLIGVGVAIYSPAWSASINEQVSPANLPAAVALGTISYNVARSFGPAMGGVIVLAFGATATFGLNALLYIPLLVAFFFWRREQLPARLPPEGVGRAMLSGTRYVFHSPILKRTLLRAFLFGLVGATANALAPLIARDTLGGDAATFGILLGAGGAGAVSGALFVSHLRARFGTELSSRLLMPIGGIGLIVIGVSTNLLLTCAALFCIGAANILVIALYNVAVQLTTPRWVLARALSLFASAMTGGIALGSWMWGALAGIWTVEIAMVVSGAAMLLMPLIAILLPLQEEAPEQAAPVQLANEPEIGLALTMRSGPVVIEVDYRVAADDARDFYNAALAFRSLRLRNGGYGWSIARDIADPEVWTERFQCLTWADYLRIRDRHTAADREAQEAVSLHLMEGHRPVVRRRLERPFGSVRWQQDSPDPKGGEAGFVVP